MPTASVIAHVSVATPSRSQVGAFATEPIPRSHAGRKTVADTKYPKTPTARLHTDTGRAPVEVSCCFTMPIYYGS